MTEANPRSPRAGFSKGAALFPLALVAAAVAILAVGAGRLSDHAPRATARTATATADPQEIALQNARAEEAAAAAMMAISLSRLAPKVDEASVAEAERGAAPRRVDEAEAQKQRERRATRQPTQTQKPNVVALAPATEPSPVAPAVEKPQGAQQDSQQEKPGLLRRVGAYMPSLPSLPSPGRIVGAMGDGVSKIAELMPKF